MDMLETSPERTALVEACDNVGGQTALARKLGLRSQGTVWGWLTRGLPPRRVLAVEDVSGVSRHRLAPKLYPVERSRPSGATTRTARKRA